MDSQKGGICVLGLVSAQGMSVRRHYIWRCTENTHREECFDYFGCQSRMRTVVSTGGWPM